MLLVTAAALWLQYVAVSRMRVWMPWRDERPRSGVISRAS
jgi:hypothetical protein